MEIKKYTLCILEDGEYVILSKKKRKIGVDKWNGYGGKIEGEETIEEANLRELKQECGITPQNIQKRGTLRFKNGDQPVIVYLLSASCTEVPKESEEMSPPQRFPKNQIPYDEMMEADRVWFPYFLKGEYFEGDFVYDNNWHLVEYKIAPQKND